MQKYRQLLPEKEEAMSSDIIKVADDVKMSEQKRNTMEAAINATAATCVGEIIRGNKWQDCPETHAAEAEVVIIQQEIMAGRGKLIDFREACEKWRKAGTK